VTPLKTSSHELQIHFAEMSGVVKSQKHLRA